MANTAQKQEAKKRIEDVTFNYQDKEYSVTGKQLNNLELFEDIEDEKYFSAARGFLGAEQWSAYKEHNRVDGIVSLDSIEGLLEAMMESLNAKN